MTILKWNTWYKEMKGARRKRKDEQEENESHEQHSDRRQGVSSKSLHFMQISSETKATDRSTTKFLRNVAM